MVSRINSAKTAVIKVLGRVQEKREIKLTSDTVCCEGFKEFRDQN